MAATTLKDFYTEASLDEGEALAALLPAGITKEIGHFNVFSIADLFARSGGKPTMPYNRRAYYKISLIVGRNTAEYADKVIHIGDHALLFASPKVPYHYVPEDGNQQGHFCIFTDGFLTAGTSRVLLDELPIFQPGGYPVFPISAAEKVALEAIFSKMHTELRSDYAYKYDLLRTYLMELIHYGQKLQPATALHPVHNASARVSSLFAELLERQFPIESPAQKLNLRTAADYAAQLAVHVNHLNKVLKETTGATTTSLISSRIVREAKILLKQTDWNVSQIAWSLGFEEVAHFSNFFRKGAGISPVTFRT